MRVASIFSLVVFALLATAVQAVESITFQRAGETLHVAGKIVVEAADGGVLLLASDGVLWDIQQKEIATRKSDGVPFASLDVEGLKKRLQAELPPGFKFHRTDHYLIVYNTSPAYAQWCGSLFERLHAGFFAYWSNKLKLDLTPPEQPLVALLFNNQQAFVEQGRGELGGAAESVLGYYSLRTNRVTTYDLTGIQAARQPEARRGTQAEINELLSHPNSERNVATLIHEATHQLAFNSGLHTRYADIPLWLNEGLAMYFETPDLKTTKGWKTIGAVNQFQLNQFRNFMGRRAGGSIQALLADAGRFRNAANQPDAYAESWAVTYYLMKVHPERFRKYLDLMAAKQPSVIDTPSERIEEFQSIFGPDLKAFDVDFTRFMKAVKGP